MEPGRGGDGARAGRGGDLARGAADGPQAVARRRPGLRRLGRGRPPGQRPRLLRPAVGGDAQVGGGQGIGKFRPY